MDEKEKKELLIALCGYLPYSVMVQVPDLFHPEIKFDVELDGVTKDKDGFHFTDDYGYTIEHIKPYLRPMDSMTEDEKKELCELAEVEAISIDDRWGSCLSWNIGTSDDYIDVFFEIDAIAKASAWLNEKKFDWHRVKVNGKYVSFIKAGLALPAPDGMYSTYKYFPPEFKTYEEYAEYLKSKGLAFDAPNGK